MKPQRVVPNWRDDLAEHLEAYPGIKAPLVAAELVDTNFNASRSALQKVCERY